MPFTNRLNLIGFFDELKTEIYCVIKLNAEFPHYVKNSDIDIFCFDITVIAQKILSFGNNYVDNGWRITVTTISEHQIHIDFYFSGEYLLDFRFDVYGRLPTYAKIQIKPAFFSTIVENRIFNDKGIYVPSKIDDLILRYVEYIEYYDMRPDKIKHINYILQCSTNNEQKLLLDKLHYYTEIPLIVELHKNENRFDRKEPLKSRVMRLIPNWIKTFIKRLLGK